MKIQTTNSRFFRARMAACLGILALFCPITSTAQQAAIGSSVLPQFVFGDGWYTAMYFTNLSGESVSFPVSFYSDLGTPLIVPSLSGSSTQVTLTPQGTAMIEAPNVGSLKQGYATFTLPVGVGGYGVFRQSNAGGQDQEAVVPFASSSGTTSTLTWDEKNITTGVAVVNPSSSTATIAITARNAAGATIGTSSLTLQPLNHTAAVLGAFPGLSGVAGQGGSAEFTTSNGNVAVLGLRFRGSAFTSIPPTTGATSQVVPTFAFKTGRYFTPSTILAGKGAIDITGPGVTDGGATLFSLAAAPGGDRCSYPSTATWFVGPIANNPWAARLSKVGITSAAFSYGVGNGTSGCPWGTNDLLGFSQIGNTLTIARFTIVGDFAAPVDQITYTLGTAAAPSVTPVSSFQAGTYRSPSTILTGQATITVTGPGASGGGTLQWSLAAAPGADRCTYPSTATWFVGPIANNPLVAARLSKAGITSAAFSYGVGKGSGGGCPWGTNDLLGFSQVGNALTIALFTSGGIDRAAP